MSEQNLRILQVSTYDEIGGAEKVAWNLFQTYRARGYGSWLAVGTKLGNDPDVLLIPNQQSNGKWSRFCLHLISGLRLREAQGEQRLWVSRFIHLLARPGKALDRYLGREDFRFPATRDLLKLPGQRPDVLHCHNLHGGYFDLRTLPSLSRQLPVILTLHDAWLLSGHCAHSFECERWRSGCGRCPDLSIDPAIQRDATAWNWRRKRAIYEQSRIFVSTPSHWLMQKVEQSILAPAILETQIIPNGVDLNVFHPYRKPAARSEVDIPQNATVLLFTANNVRHNMWKDYLTFRAAITLVADHFAGQEMIFIALGEDAPPQHIGRAELRFVPYQKDPAAVARYYQAADVYVHAARVDTFPNTVLEALACGAPVVATAVGGIPEQIEDGETGFLVPPGDPQALAARLIDVLSAESLRQALGAQAATTARFRFDLRRQADTYLAWYHTLVQCEKPARSNSKTRYALSND